VFACAIGNIHNLGADRHSVLGQQTEEETTWGRREFFT
jgi:hypothetical protein